MYCTRCLQILICIVAVLILTNGIEDGLDSLSSVNRIKQHELGMEEDSHYGLRGELDRDGRKPGFDLLLQDKARKGKIEKGMVENLKKSLHYENVVQSESQTTKCTTNQPILVDVNAEMKNSEEATPSPEDVTDITNEDTTIPGDIIVNETTINDGDETGNDVTGNTVDDITNTIMTLAKASGENKVHPFNGEKDPSREDDYDATVSTKTYYGPHASYFPDHYLDDA